MAEEPGGVLVGELGHVGVGEAGEALGQERLGVGPRGVGVGVVALHHDVVDADAVAHLQRGRVVDGAEPEVALHRLRRRDPAPDASVPSHAPAMPDAECSIT